MKNKLPPIGFYQPIEVTESFVPVAPTTTYSTADIKKELHWRVYLGQHAWYDTVSQDNAQMISMLARVMNKLGLTDDGEEFDGEKQGRKRSKRGKRA